MSEDELRLLRRAVVLCRNREFWLQITPDGLVEVSRRNHADRPPLWEIVGLNEKGLRHLIGKLEEAPIGESGASSVTGAPEGAPAE